MDTTQRTTITAHQVCTVLRRSATSSHLPEGRLWIEVLTLAVKDLRCGTELHRRSARAFVESSHFLNVCELCGLDPTYTKELINTIGTSVDVVVTEESEKHE